MTRCPDCGSDLAPGLLSCPGCRRLVHSDELKTLAADAGEAEKRGDLAAAIVSWRRALELLPAETSQHRTITGMVDALSRRIDAGEGTSAARDSGLAKGGAGLGIAGLLTFLATKGKLLLVGLTKGSTFFSMLLSMGVYWSMWGWKFAVGFVLSIYIHEMGHVAAMIRFGIRASVPMFLPGLGAVIRLDQYPANAREDARIGLAGPLWGMGAALASAGLFALTGAEYWGGLARVGAWINLFNLLPVWQLDGSRGFRSLSRGQRLSVAALAGAAWSLSADPMLLIIALVAAGRAFESRAPKERDWTSALQFALLIAVLSALLVIPLPSIDAARR